MQSTFCAPGTVHSIGHKLGFRPSPEGACSYLLDISTYLIIST